MPVLCTNNGTMVKKHLKMHKYGQKANNFCKTIKFHDSYVEKLVIAWLCGHLER